MLLLLENKGIRCPPESIHKFVRESLVDSANSLERKTGHDLRRLWRRRVDADYSDTVVISQEDASGAYGMARAALKRMRI